MKYLEAFSMERTPLLIFSLMIKTISLVVDSDLVECIQHLIICRWGRWDRWDRWDRALDKSVVLEDKRNNNNHMSVNPKNIGTLIHSVISACKTCI